MVKPTDRRVRERVVVKSPVRENRPPGSVRGTRGNPRPYSISGCSQAAFSYCKPQTFWYALSCPALNAAPVRAELHKAKD